MDLVASSVQQLPQKLEMSSFLTLGEKICRHRCAFDPVEPRLVAELALLDHAELNSEAFVLRRLTCWGTGSEESICQALAIVHAQGVSPQSTPYSTRNISVCSRPAENAAHSAPRELLTTRRILREFQASTETVEDSPRRMFGCAAMIT